VTQTGTHKPLAVVVASGGLDSCVVAAMTAQTHRIAMLHAQYGQRTAGRELQAFHAIADAVGASIRLVIQLGHFAAMGGSALTDVAIAVPETPARAVPVTYVPFRNANLLAAAVSWAEVIGADTIFTGINQVDGSGYPDCTQAFLDAFNHLAAIGTRPETHIDIAAPLITLSKRDIVALGLKIKAPLHLSWSCYQNSDTACGVCDSCRLRLDGFAKNNARDPIPYRQP
jgi:7-cyano-7-deazaguanine synthase